MRIGQVDPPSWWKDPPPRTGVYPLTSRCWCCGRFAQVHQEYAHRWCPHCEVRWHELLPGQVVTTRQDLEGQQLLLSAKWPLRRHAEYADNYDQIIDHGAVKLISPA